MIKVLFAILCAIVLLWFIMFFLLLFIEGKIFVISALVIFLM